MVAADPDPFEPIETARLRLRCLRLEDAAAYAATLSPDVVAWLASWPPVVTAGIAADRIAESRHRMREEGGLISLGVERLSDGAILGGVGAVVKPQTPDRAEIGYHLGPEHHGQGYVTEAVSALIGALWDLTRVDMIEAGARPENAASLRVLHKLGMEPTGERAVFAIARDRWEVCRYFALRRTAT